jgi:peptidoglycan/LPS O-acetylase OafA/YrhL
MVALSLLSRGLILGTGGGIEHIWLNTLCRLDPIAVGALIALGRPGRPVTAGRARRAVIGAGAPLLVVASTGVLWYELLRPTHTAGSLVLHPGITTLVLGVLIFLIVALCCGALVVIGLSSPGSWLGHPALVYLGRISYGLYVFHLASIRLVESLWWPWRCLLSFGIAVMAASLSYRLLEQPFLRLKERFAYVPSAPIAAEDPTTRPQVPSGA